MRPPARRTRRRPGGRGCPRGPSGPSGRAAARAAQTWWTTPGPVGGAHLEDGRPRRRLGAYDDRRARAGPGSPAEPRGRRRPARRRSPRSRWRSTAVVEVAPRRRPRPRPPNVVLGPGPGGAHRGPLQREQRRRVGEQPDPVAGEHGDPRAVVAGLDLDRDRARGRTSLGTIDHLAARRRRATGSPEQRRRPRTRPRGSGRPARSIHALGEVARASASVSVEQQRERLGGRRSGR